MAIYHFSGTVISRSRGKSVVASAAYRSGEKLYDERQERLVDYSRKQDVIYKEIMLPEGAPKWMMDRERLWNAVEMAEKRKDAQLAREFNFSLPREFTKEQNIELAREFVQNEFVAQGMVADVCIHDGKAKDGEGQPHAHVMLTLRKVTGNGFGLKERGWNAKENLLLWREAWAECANKHLALNGIGQRIDHKTLEEQGIDLEAQKKIGPDILRIYDARIEEHQRIAKENGDKILDDPTIALKAITHHQSTFTHQDLARFVNRHTIDAEQFQLVYEKVKASDQIITLTDENGKERFTTKEMLVLERKMLDDAVSLKNGFLKPVINTDEEVISGVLTNQQRGALKHIIEGGDIKCLVGYAGTGKSHLLNQARELWEKEGYRVHGATLSGIAAENLEAASGIESRTLASRCYYWDKGTEYLTKKDILVVDEAGMLGSRQVGRVLEEVKVGGAKAVFIGDPQQLQAIEAGAAFRAISEQVGYLELTEIKRQQEMWQQEATKEFALRHTEAALSLYEQNDRVHFYETQDRAKTSLVEMWNDVRISQSDKSQIMLAYTRRDAQELNEMARDCRIKNGELGESWQLQTSGGKKGFAIGDRIYFLQNDRNLGVKNGTLGTIKNIENVNAEGQGKITIKLDKDDMNANAKNIVTIDLEHYNHITHGYAATIHKAQGVTVNRSYILASKHLDSHAIYVGMSRHRERADLFWSKEEFADKRELEHVLSRDRSKDITLDYLDFPTHEKERSIYGVDGTGDIYEGTKGDGLNNNLVDYKIDEADREVGEIYGIEGKNNKTDNIALDDFRAFQEKFEREHPDLAIEAQEEVKTAKFLQDQREEFIRENNQKSLEHRRAKQINIIDRDQKERGASYSQIQQPTDIRTEKSRGEKLIDKYYEFKDRYHDLQESGRSGFSEIEAKGNMGRCAHKICNDKDAMDYLQKNDRALFSEMRELKEQEKVLETQKERELELSL